MASVATTCGIIVNSIPSLKDTRVATPLRHIGCAKPIRGVKGRQNCLQVRAFLDAGNDPIVKEALKEPIAFLGGVFAGLLRLDLNEEPLREWIAKTAEAAGIETEEPEPSSSDGGPNEIQIE